MFHRKLCATPLAILKPVAGSANTGNPVRRQRN